MAALYYFIKTEKALSDERAFKSIENSEFILADAGMN